MALIGSVSSASAITVDSTGESGCSLRAAINAAATNNSGTSCGAVVSGGTTPINLPANTYTPFDGQLLVPAGANISINGANVNNPLTTVIDATNNDPRRVFEIKSGANVTMSGLTITGGRTSAGAIAGNPFQAFPGDDGGGILNGGVLTLDHVVVTGNKTGAGGQGAAGPAENNGGGGGSGGSGGGIYNASGASLTVSFSTISDNITGAGGEGGVGGNGVSGLGHRSDASTGGRGGPAGSGGGIFNLGSVTISKSTISGNQTGRGGLGGDGGVGALPFTVNTSHFPAGRGGNGGQGGNNGRGYNSNTGFYEDNAVSGGGGINNRGSLTISDSTISNNNTGAGGNGGVGGPEGDNLDGSFSDGGGGGFGGGAGPGGGLLVSQIGANATLTNVTLAGNYTGQGGAGGGGGTGGLGGGHGGYGGLGGGIWALGSSSSGSVVLNHVTIAKNAVGAGGPGGPDNVSPGQSGIRGKGAGINTASRTNPGTSSGLYIKNSIVASNGNFAAGDVNCTQYYPPEQYVDISDQGHNISYGTVGFLDNTCPGDNGDPALGLLGDHGGPTETMLPNAGSVAIGGVPLASCTVPNDQRGFPRPGADGVSCDIGAVETGTAPTLTPTTTSVTSSANPSSPGQQVTFTATVSPPPSSEKVAFTDNGTTIPGCGATDLKPGGQFTCTTTYSSAGSHSIVASYAGNSLFGPSTSPAYSQTVGSAPPPDTTAPDTTIDSGPSGTVNSADATFTFHGTAGDTAKVQCSIDSGAFVDCTSPRTFTALSDGSHTASFRAIDAAGNTDATPATRSFTVDTSGGGGGSGGTVTAGGAKTSGTSALVPFTCAGGTGVSCILKLDLSTLVFGKGKARSPIAALFAKKPKRQKVAVGAGHVTLPAGTTKKVKIALNGKGRKLLKKAGKLKVTLTVSEQENGTYKKVLTKGLTFKAKKKKKR